jgi:hypothetical protein
MFNTQTQFRGTDKQMHSNALISPVASYWSAIVLGNDFDTRAPEQVGVLS